jgi:hypothetical protein
MGDERRFYEAPASGMRRSAPAALRNREPIAEVLREWLPESGLVLEIASGTGEHVVHFAECFPNLEWQPSDIHADALTSVEAWRRDSGLANVLEPLALDASSPEWPIDRADAVLSINMVHISPWASALGLLDGAVRLLPPEASLIMYGPWITSEFETAPSNLEFDGNLRACDPQWGLRSVEEFAAAAAERGLKLKQTRTMPANNLMLLFLRA